MVPFWRLQFWTDHILNLIPVSKIAVPIAILWSFAERMLVGAADAFAFSPYLLAISVSMVLLDTGTGCWKAIQSEKTVWSTMAFGGAIDKVLKYTVIIIVFSGIASAGENAQLPAYAFSWLRDFGYLVVIIREGGSAVENVSGKSLGEVISQARKRMSSVQS
jgi:hypothetical protein